MGVGAIVQAFKGKQDVISIVRPLLEIGIPAAIISKSRPYEITRASKNVVARLDRLLLERFWRRAFSCKWRDEDVPVAAA